MGDFKTESALKAAEDQLEAPAVTKAQRDMVLQKYAPTQKQAPTASEGKDMNLDTKINAKPVLQKEELGISNSSQQQMAAHSASLKPEIQMGETSERKHGKETADVFVAPGTQFDGKAAHPLNTAATLDVSKNGSKTATIPEVFQKVESLVHQGGGKMTVALNLPTLGRVEIEVTTRGKNVEIQMKSQSDLAKTALENKLDDLKHSMSTQISN